MGDGTGRMGRKVGVRVRTKSNGMGDGQVGLGGGGKPSRGRAMATITVTSETINRRAEESINGRGEADTDERQAKKRRLSRSQRGWDLPSVGLGRAMIRGCLQVVISARPCSSGGSVAAPAVCTRRPHRDLPLGELGYRHRVLQYGGARCSEHGSLGACDPAFFASSQEIKKSLLSFRGLVQYCASIVATHVRFGQSAPRATYVIFADPAHVLAALEMPGCVEQPAERHACQTC